MKKLRCIILFILLFIMLFSLPVSAESDEPIMCGEAFNVGDRIYYYGRVIEYTTTISEPTYDQYVLVDTSATASNLRVCIYLEDTTASSSGKHFRVYNNMINGNLYNTADNSLKSSGYGIAGYAPTEYLVDTWTGKLHRENVEFKTNIPIFENKADADVYYNTGEGLNKAINYKKVFENGSWVKPFESIEMNDSEIIVPELINISHDGFSLANCNDEKYLCEIYMDSGVQLPSAYFNNSMSIEGSLYVNSYGLVSDLSEVYEHSSTFCISQLYGINNYEKLKDSLSQFYTAYPSSYHYTENLINNPTDFAVLWSIWGKPLGVSYVAFTYFTNIEKYIDNVNVDLCPIAWTNYKVRYFYYDDDTGWHKGPWANVVYFSDGRTSSSGVFESDNGVIIETPTNNGRQDGNGDIVYSDTANLVSLNNPNELFGYIRSLFNNMSATTNTFSQVFGSVFNFLPPEIIAIIFGGIAAMVLIGIIKAIVG